MNRFESLFATSTIAVAAALAVISGELSIRLIDGYSWRSFKLQVVQNTSAQALDAAALGTDEMRDTASQYAKAIRGAPELNPSWFLQEPLPLQNRKSPNRYFRKIMQTADIHFDLFKLWNVQFVISHPEYFNKFPGFAYVFVPADDAPRPIHRYFPNSTSPVGLVTNQFAFRGRQIALSKPPATIRIAFVGSSTVVSRPFYPFSYPELVEFWLNRWATEAKLNVHFEAINAGREGIDSEDITNAFVHDVLPLRPDIVVYYEGGNQFDLDPLISLPQDRPTSPRRSAIGRIYSWLGIHSATWRRIARHIPGGALREGPRPDYALNWPAGVDENNPDLNAPNLPVNLPEILKNLDAIRSATKAADAEMILSSFKWFVYDGMALDPARHYSIHEYLEKRYPWRYRDMRRLADFQNRVFERYAARNGLFFIDVGRMLPNDPDLFVDGVHKTYLAEKLQAWIVANQLIPLIRKRLAQGRWANKSVDAPVEYPLSGTQVAKMTLPTSNDSCSDKKGHWSIALKDVKPAYRLASVEAGDVLTIRTGPEQWLYAAEALIFDDLSQSAAVITTSIEYEVVSGRVGFGILTPDKSRFLTQKLGEAGPKHTLSLSLFRQTRSGNPWLNIYNGSDSGPSVVRIRAINVCSEALEPIGGGTFRSLATELDEH